MALDAHRHFWRYTDAEFGWIADDCLRRDFLPGDCAGMDPCVAVEARQTVEETRQLLRHSNINTTLIYSHALERSKNNSEARITKAIFGNK